MRLGIASSPFRLWNSCGPNTQKFGFPRPLCRWCGLRTACARLHATGLDLLGIGDRDPPEPLLAALRDFDSIVSWYGENRPEFREVAVALNSNWTFLKALPPDGLRDACDGLLCRK